MATGSSDSNNESDCTTGGAFPSASPSNPTSASTSKALVPAGPVVAPAFCPASEDTPAATCCGEVKAEPSSGGDDNDDDVSSDTQGEARLVVTFEDGSVRRFPKSVVKAFYKLPVSVSC